MLLGLVAALPCLRGSSVGSMGCRLLQLKPKLYWRNPPSLGWRPQAVAWDPYQPAAKRTPHRFPLRPSLPVLENGTAYTRDAPYKPSALYYPPPPPPGYALGLLPPPTAPPRQHRVCMRALHGLNPSAHLCHPHLGRGYLNRQAGGQVEDSLYA